MANTTITTRQFLKRKLKDCKLNSSGGIQQLKLVYYTPGPGLYWARLVFVSTEWSDTNPGSNTQHERGHSKAVALKDRMWLVCCRILQRKWVKNVQIFTVDVMNNIAVAGRNHLVATARGVPEKKYGCLHCTSIDFCTLSLKFAFPVKILWSQRWSNYLHFIELLLIFFVGICQDMVGQLK